MDLPPISARFHFDPRHDPTVVPDRGRLEEWMRARMVSDGHLRNAIEANHRSRRHGVWARVVQTIPFLARRADRIRGETYLAAAMAEMTEAHEAMREFATDLTAHPELADALEAIAAVAVINLTERDSRRFVEEARARHAKGTPTEIRKEIDGLEDLLDQLDTEQRIASYNAGIRARLEMEAVGNLLAEGEDAIPWERRRAGLEAAIEEVRQVDVRKALMELAARR